MLYHFERNVRSVETPRDWWHQHVNNICFYTIFSGIVTKLMVPHDLLRSMVSDHLTFDQQDLKSFPTFERMIDRCFQVLVSKLETLDMITFT